MELLILQLLAIAIKIGSSKAEISTAVDTQESTTIDDLLDFTDQNKKFKDDPQVEQSENEFEIIPCSLSDPGKNECIRGLFNQVLPKLKLLSDNIRSTILTDGHLVNNDSSVKVQLSRLNANLAVSNARVNANGIFSDRNLNNMILNLVNENLLEIIRVGIPSTREQWSPVLVEHINNFFSNVPIEKFLLQ
uniref:Uncharacterized protein n=1 Tax=Glossina brevipalpis TaxID=37001 RepID=A0A1A9WXH3_9MUSC